MCKYILNSAARWCVVLDSTATSLQFSGWADVLARSLGRPRGSSFRKRLSGKQSYSYSYQHLLAYMGYIYLLGKFPMKLRYFLMYV